MSFTDFLRRTPLFFDLAEGQYEALDRIIVEKKVKRGETIFSEGDPAAGLYVVAEGQVKIYKLSLDGKEQILHVFGPGEPFAEVAVFTGTTYPAHAMALRNSRLLFLPKREFAALIDNDPSLAMNMLASMSKRLKKFAAMIESLSLQEVPARLATHLLLLKRKQDSPTVELSLPKGQLASLLGTIPETLSRILAKMSRDELIQVEGNRMRILDEDGLADVAAGERRL
ncbi:MAG: Crp/Fnr family transcriptional regulator [Thermodesulfobacteriota bacterium]